MTHMLQAAAFHLLCWAAFARTKSTSGRLWQDIARCDVISVNNNYTKTFENILSSTHCCYRCLAEEECEHFFYSRQGTRCLIFPPPCQRLQPGDDTGYQLFSSTEVTKCPLEKGYYYYGSSQLCLQLDLVQRSYNDAQQFCETEGGHLITISSESEFTNLKHYILNIQGFYETMQFFWLGAIYDKPAKVWRWIDSPVVTVNIEWDVNQLSPYPDEIYLKMCITFLLSDANNNPQGVMCEVDVR